MDLGVERRKIHASSTMKKKPKINPSTGETTKKTRVLEIPLHSKALSPVFERPAPTRPPTSACDELKGKPKCQVMRFPMMAPARAAKTRGESRIVTLMIPLPIVLATTVPKTNTARKLKAAA